MNGQHHLCSTLVGTIMFMFTQLGCGGVEPTIRQQPTSDHPAVPAITAERLQQCVKEYGHQLDGGSWAFSPTVQVDPQGYVVNAHAGEIPKTAPALAACTRDVMRSMAIPGWIFDLPQSVTRNEPTAAQRIYIGSPAVVVVVVVEVALAELVLEAGAFTVLFAATVQVVDKVADDVAELAKRRRNRWREECTERFVECIASPAGRARGNAWNYTRCATCREICDKDKGKWPSTINIFGQGDVSCY